MQDRIRWQIQLPGQDYQEITPDIQEMGFDDELYKDKFFRRNLNVDMILEKDDFDLVYAIELSNDPCTSLPIKLQLWEKSTSQFVDKWFGSIAVRSDYNLNACRATFSPITNDVYDCIINGEKQTIDLFQIEDRYEIDTVIGELEFETSRYSLQEHDGFDTVFTQQFPISEGWGLESRFLEVIERGSKFLPSVFDILVSESYVRQFLIQPTQPADGWINVGGNKWVFSVPIRLDGQEERFSNTGDLNGDEFEKIRSFRWIYVIVDIEADNGIKFADIIPLLIDCGESIISNFFDYNSDATAPDNSAYQFAAEYLQNIYVYQASDIINADASQNATKFELKRGELLDDILDFFKLELFFDSTADAYRLEHVSYRNALRGANFLTARYDEIKDSYRYKYDTDQIPQSIPFSFKFDTNSEQFDGALIELDPICTNGNEEPVRLSNIVTNISELYENDNYKTDNALFSAVFISVKNGVAVSQNGVVNNPLSFKTILEALHIYGQHLPEGLVNGKLMTFSSVRPTKLQDITITMSRAQFFDTYSPNKEYKTQLGWGRVKSSQYDFENKQLSIKLLH